MAASSEEFLIAFAKSKNIALPAEAAGGTAGGAAGEPIAKLLLGKGLKEKHLVQLLGAFIIGAVS